MSDNPEPTVYVAVTSKDLDTVSAEGVSGWVPAPDDRPGSPYNGPWLVRRLGEQQLAALSKRWQREAAAIGESAHRAGPAESSRRLSAGRPWARDRGHEIGR